MRPSARACRWRSRSSREPAVGERGLQGLVVVAGIQQAAGRRAIGKRIRRHEVAPDDLDRIDLQFDGDALHQPFQRVIDLRTAEAAIEPGRRLVGQDDAVAYQDVTDGVGAGQVAVHAVKRGRLRRPDMGADIFELVPGERRDAAVGRDRRLQRHDAVGRRDRRGEMLEPILDPFDRPSAHPRGDRDQHDIGEHALFDAEAAAGIGRRAQPETIDPAPSAPAP